MVSRSRTGKESHPRRYPKVYRVVRKGTINSTPDNTAVVVTGAWINGRRYDFDPVTLYFNDDLDVEVEE